MLDAVKRQKCDCKDSVHVLPYRIGNLGQNHEMQQNTYNSCMRSMCILTSTVQRYICEFCGHGDG